MPPPLQAVEADAPALLPEKIGYGINSKVAPAPLRVTSGPYGENPDRFTSSLATFGVVFSSSGDRCQRRCCYAAAAWQISLHEQRIKL